MLTSPGSEESGASRHGRAERSFSTKAAERRAKLAGVSWRAFFADLGVRFIVSACVVLAVVIALTLLLRR